MESKTNKYLTTPILVILISLYYSPIVATPRPPQHGQTHFVLVHGAGHGAWCWYKLIPILKSHGHNVTALDLAASGIDLRRAERLRSFAEYIEPLMGVMESLGEDEKVILVAHSMGGLAVSKAMEMFHDKVHMAIFVTALMPGPTFNFTLLSHGVSESLDIDWENARRVCRRQVVGVMKIPAPKGWYGSQNTCLERSTHTFEDVPHEISPHINSQHLVRWQAPLLDLKFVFGNGPSKPPTLSIGGPLFISLTMYDLSPKKDVELAMLLVRPQRLFSNEETDTSLVLTPARYGSVNRIFIVSKKDKSLVKEFQLWMIKNNPPNYVEHIHDSDHMVMISKPLDLGVRLLSLAKKFA